MKRVEKIGEIIINFVKGGDYSFVQAKLYR